MKAYSDSSALTRAPRWMAWMLLAPMAMSVAAQTTHHVPADFPTIQDAIDAASEGDTVLVSPGTYFERIVVHGKNLVLRSSDGPEVTTIDGEHLGTVVTFEPGVTRETVLEGFTLTHGDGWNNAGGVLIASSSPVIRGNVIEWNLGAGSGNGITVLHSSALIEGNTIRENHNNEYFVGGGGGGGIYAGGCPMQVIHSGSCGPEIRGNLIEANTVDRFSSGGGINLFSGGNAMVIGNIIRRNTAPSQGAAIAVFNYGNVVIENNLIVENIVSLENGAGGGIYSASSPRIVNNTIVANRSASGSGIYSAGGEPELHNNIVVAEPGVSAIECDNYPGGQPPALTHNNVVATDAAVYAGICADVTGNDGNISVQPVFAGPGDYRLALGSSGIDAGWNNASFEATDLLGAFRISDGDSDGDSRIDMGAYEFVPDTLFFNGFE